MIEYFMHGFTSSKASLDIVMMMLYHAIVLLVVMLSMVIVEPSIKNLDLKENIQFFRKIITISGKGFTLIALFYLIIAIHL